MKMRATRSFSDGHLAPVRCSGGNAGVEVRAGSGCRGRAERRHGLPFVRPFLRRRRRAFLADIWRAIPQSPHSTMTGSR